MVNYPSPVDRLPMLGKPISPWPDYLALGLTAADIPDLIRLALDNQFADLNADEHPEVWAPIHAWRALGQLRAAEAAEPLTHLLQRVDDEDDDWVGEDLPEAFGLIGPSAIPVLRAYLADPSHGEFARAAASNSLVEIAKLYPDARAECAAAIAVTLEHFAENDDGLNGLLITDLADLKAVEHAALIEQAFAADKVDLFVMGDWEDVQIELGLKAQRETPSPFAPLQQSLARLTAAQHAPRARPRSDTNKAKAKAKRKRAVKSRRKNRKRK